MERVNGTNFYVQYSGPILFRNSPCIIEIVRTNVIVTKALVTVEDVNDGVYVDYDFSFGDAWMGNTLRVDVSRALQLYGKDIVVYVICQMSNGSTENLQFYIFNVDGAKGALDVFGDTWHIRKWGNLPLNVQFLYYQDTLIQAKDKFGEYDLTSASAETDSEYDWVNVPVAPRLGVKKLDVYGNAMIYSDHVWEISPWNYHIKIDCVPTGKKVIYLRWMDMQGLTWYWLFEVVEEIVTSQEDISYGRSHIQGDNGAYNEWTSERNKIVTRKYRIGTYNITKEEYKVVSSLASSSVVDAYHDDSWEWYRIRVVDGEFTTPKGNYKDFEIEIEFAPQQTQLPK